MISRALALSVSLLFAVPLASLCADEPESPSEALDAAKKKLTRQSYRLQYKFAAGQQLRWKVIHLVTVETKIQGVVETAKTRSMSLKLWQVTDVDADGNMTLTHSVEEAKMWQSVSGRQEIRFDSTSGEEPPPEYTHVAESVGVPLATVTIAPSGKVIDRQSERKQFNPGIGDLTIPFPETAIRIGQSWATDGELAVRMQDTRVKRVKIRQMYQLEKVEAGVATISMKTQVLTPVNDPKMQSQLVQRLKQGVIKFDVDAGHILAQQMDIDETVIGFNGPESIMKYLSRLSEEEVKSENVAVGPAPPPR